MELEKFIENFAGQFEETEVENITANVDFKSLETWDSLTAMSVQVMIEDEYEVKIVPIDFKATTTVKDLYNLIQSRISK
jgi:acyl carrier protein